MWPNCLDIKGGFWGGQNGTWIAFVNSGNGILIVTGQIVTGRCTEITMKSLYKAHSRQEAKRMIRQRILAGLFATLLGAGVSGCDTTASDVAGTNLFTGVEWYIALDVVSIINTDKTLVDHVVSLSTGRDCSTIRKIDGKSYCKKDPVPEPPLYCYRTLASVSCYRTPDPYNTGAQTVDWPPTRSRSL